jgi:hypothetical protein
LSREWIFPVLGGPEELLAHSYPTDEVFIPLCTLSVEKDVRKDLF